MPNPPCERNGLQLAPTIFLFCSLTDRKGTAAPPHETREPQRVIARGRRPRGDSSNSLLAKSCIVAGHVDMSCEWAGVVASPLQPGQQAAFAHDPDQIPTGAGAELFHQVGAVPVQCLVADPEVCGHRLGRLVGQQSA